MSFSRRAPQKLHSELYALRVLDIEIGGKMAVEPPSPYGDPFTSSDAKKTDGTVRERERGGKKATYSHPR